MVRRCVIYKPREWGSPGPLGAVAPREKKRLKWRVVRLNFQNYALIPAKILSSQPPEPVMMVPTLRNLKHSRRYNRRANTLVLTLFCYTGGSNNNLVLTLFCYTHGRHTIGHQPGAHSVLLYTRKAHVRTSTWYSLCFVIQADRTTTWCSLCFVIHAEGTWSDINLVLTLFCYSSGSNISMALTLFCDIWGRHRQHDRIPEGKSKRIV